MDADGRPFKLDLKKRFLMLFECMLSSLHNLYLVRGFLFELDQSNICSRDIQKIEKRLVIQCIQIPQKNIQNNKEAKNAREGGREFSSIISFIGSTEQQQQKYQDMPIIKERGYVLFGKEEKRHTAIKTHRLFMVNNQASSSFIN